MKCTCCGADVPENSTICYTCGASIDFSSKSNAEASSTQALEDIKLCPICGAQISENSTICYSCGATIAENQSKPAPQSAENVQSKARKCEKCGAELPNGSTVCFACGATQTGITKLPKEKARLEKELKELEAQAQKYKEPKKLKKLCVTNIILASLMLGILILAYVVMILGFYVFSFFTLAFSVLMESEIFLLLIPIIAIVIFVVILLLLLIYVIIFIIISSKMYKMSGNNPAKAFLNIPTCGIFALVNAIIILVKCNKVSPERIEIVKKRLAEVNKAIEKNRIGVA